MTQARFRLRAGGGYDVGDRRGDGEAVVAATAHDDALHDVDAKHAAAARQTDLDPLGRVEPAPEPRPLEQDGVAGERRLGREASGRRGELGRLRSRERDRSRPQRNRSHGGRSPRSSGRYASQGRVWGIVGSVEDSGSSCTGANVMSWKRAK